MTTAYEHFTRKLAFETDVADVAQALRDGSAGFTLVDTRSERAYADGHLPGAISLVETGADGLPDGPLVVYCWGPACNGATKAGAKLSALGRDVKEMIGGYEYWVREGHAVRSKTAA
jgi:rhodanese-related sulfurtransferase